MVGWEGGIRVEGDGSKIAMIAAGTPRRIVVHTWSGRGVVAEHVVWDVDSDQATHECDAATATIESRLHAVMPTAPRVLDKYTNGDHAHLELHCARGGSAKRPEAERLVVANGAIELRRKGRRTAKAPLQRRNHTGVCPIADSFYITVDPEGGLASVTAWASDEKCTYFTRLPSVMRDALNRCGPAIAGP